VKTRILGHRLESGKGFNANKLRFRRGKMQSSPDGKLEIISIPPSAHES
jgi:hypothetical protein